jgi:hypothetical protein
MEHTEKISRDGIPPCRPKMTIRDAVHTQTDSAGNTFEIFCRNGSYEGSFTPKGGATVYVGRCKYWLGENLISKKLWSTFSVKVTIDRNSLVVKEVQELVRQEIQRVNWKNVAPVGPPPTNGTKPHGAMGEGEDTLWVFDVATGKITKQKTKHTGHWVLNNPGDDLTKPENWSWIVQEQAADGEPENMAAPKTADGLGMRVGGPSHGVLPADANEFATVAPVTVWSGQRFATLAAHKPFGERGFRVEPVAAVVGERFKFALRLPNIEERLLRFALLEGPRGMTVDRYSGVMRWTPKPDQVGAHKVAVVHRYHELTPHIDEFVLEVLQC